MIKHALLLFLLCLVSFSLWADYATWLKETEQGSEYIKSNPEDDTARIHLAYAYMMSNQPLLALREYRILSQKDKTNLPAQAGVLWALNNLKQYSITKKNAKELIQQYPQYPAFHNLIAYAYLKTAKNSSARYHYDLGLKYEAFDLYSRQISYDGLGWAYSNLGDYPRAIASFDKAASLSSDSSESYGRDELLRLGLKSTLSYAMPSLKGGNKSDDVKKEAIRYTQTIRSRSWKANLAAEEFRVEGEHFRFLYAVEVQKQFKPLQITAVYVGINGDDERVYPANIASLGAAFPLYYKMLWLVPSLRYSHGRYERFDTQQADGALQIGMDGYALAYTHSRSFQDNEAVDSDTLRVVNRISFSVPIPANIALTLSYSSGATDFHLDKYANVSDKFSSQDRSYGVSIHAPLSQSISITQFTQYAKVTEGWEYLLYLNLAISY